MRWSDIIQRIIFFSLTGPGVVGNFLVLVRYVCTLVIGSEKKPTGLMLIHLAVSSILIICTTGIRDIATVIYFSNFLGDIVCKAVMYLNRVARSLSICTTCLLSVVQAVTVSPRTTWWRKLKPRTAWQLLPYLLLFWVFSLLISSNLLHYITAVNSVNGSGVRMYAEYCYMLPAGRIVRWLFLSLMALRDLTFQSAMGWSSGHMALRLYKHHKHVLYLQSFRTAKHSSPEVRATQSTLVLMTCFLFSYWTDFIFSFYTGSTLTRDSTILNIQIFLGLSYACVSPFVLISRDVHIGKCWWSQRNAGN